MNSTDFQSPTRLGREFAPENLVLTETKEDKKARCRRCHGVTDRTASLSAGDTELTGAW